MYRIECEFRIKFNKKEVKNIPETYKYFELSELEQKAQEYMGLVDSEIGKKYLYQYMNNNSNEVNNIRYFKDFWWRGLKLILSRQNPFIILHKQITRKVLDKQIKQELLDTLTIDFINFLSPNIEKWDLSKTKQENNS